MKMKKGLSMILSCVFAPLLIACGGSDNNYQETNQRYINNLFNIYESGRMYNLNNAIESSKAMYTDFNTLESVPLCAKPNCNHNNSECAANTITGCPVEYNDYIYFFSSQQGINETGNGKREFYINSKLRRVSMESSEVETIAEFHDCVPYIEEGYFLDGNELYFTGTDMGPKEDEYGNIGVSNVGGTQLLCCINLDTGKYFNYGSVYDGDRQYSEADHSRKVSIAGCYNSKIYIKYSFLKEAISDKDRETAYEKGIDLRNRFTRLCFEFDLDTKKLTESKFPVPSYVDSDSYVGYDYDNKKAFVIYKGEQLEFGDCDTRYNTSLINNKLFALDSQKWYDMSDMSEHSMGEYGDYLCIAYYDNYYILVCANKTIKLTEEELLSL